MLNSTAGMSIDEMSVNLEISRNAVKQHLVLLEKQQLVQEAGLNSHTGGRPGWEHLFSRRPAWQKKIVSAGLPLWLHQKVFDRC